MELTESQFHRYARHLILDEIGEEGQIRLLESRVLIVGAGGLGAPLLMYLAAAGVGRIGIIDDDVVDLTNLQRQVAYRTEDIGLRKVECAARMVRALNPDVRVDPHAMRLDAANADALIAAYDVVADGSDNFATRYAVHDACWRARTPLVSAALLRFEGQLFTFRGGADTGCYRCLFPEPPDPDLVPRCEQAGVLGALAGVMGSLQAVEVLKALLDLGDSLAGRMVIYDALAGAFHTIALARDPACPLCGTRSAQSVAGG